jgi:hypothetical protein
MVLLMRHCIVVIAKEISSFRLKSKHSTLKRVSTTNPCDARSAAPPRSNAWMAVPVVEVVEALAVVTEHVITAGVPDT